MKAGPAVGKRSHFTPYYFLVAGVLLQGLSPVLTKLLLTELSNATVVAARYLLAFGFLMPFGYSHTVHAPDAPRPRRRDWVALILVGALGSGFGALLFTAAIEYSHAGIANAISKTAPILVAFLAYFTLHERITWARFSLVLMMVMAAGLIGLGELSFGLATAKQHLFGDALALAAGVLRALAEILGKGSLRRFRPATVAMWRFGVGFLITGIISVATTRYSAMLTLSTPGWVYMLLLAGISTSLSMALYYRGLSSIPAHVAVTLKLLGAIVTAILSWIVLSEALNAFHISGIAVLVFGAYLIVMRTARQEADQPADSAPPATPPRPRPWAASFRNKIAALVAGAIAVTMLLGTALAVRHTNSVIAEQVRFAMSDQAFMLLQYQTLGRGMDRDGYRELLRKTVAHKFERGVYSVDILYAVLLDEHGVVIAYAADEEVRRMTPEGARARPDADTLGLELLALVTDPAFWKRADVQPLTAELEGHPQVLKMGSRMSIARRAAAEITVRYSTLAVLLIIAGVLVAGYLVGYLTRPLEQLSVAAGRIAAGELNVPLFTRGADEVNNLSAAMSDIVGDLQTAAVLRRGILRVATDNGAGDAHPPVQLAIRISESTTREPDVISDEHAAQATAIIHSFITAISDHDGEIIGYGGGRILAGWGAGEAERDDVLRAVLAGLDVVAASGARAGAGGLNATLLVEFMPQTDIGADLEQLAPVVTESAGPLLYIGESASMQVADYIDAKPVGAGRHRLVYGLADEQAMQQIARSPDE